MMIHTEPSGNGKTINFLFTELTPQWEFMVRIEKQHPAIFIPHVYATLEQGIRDGTPDGARRWKEVLLNLPTILGDLIGFK